MEFISIFNDVLGPVMRGPSSSHTAGSQRLGHMFRSLLGAQPSKAVFTFDPSGSYGQVYKQQGVDLAFAAGLMEWPLADKRFLQALELASQQQIEIAFGVSPFPEANHPNAVKAELYSAKGENISILARSIGGGAVEITKIDSWPVRLDGKDYSLLVACDKTGEQSVKNVLSAQGAEIKLIGRHETENGLLLHFGQNQNWTPGFLSQLERIPDVFKTWQCDPVFYTQKGEPLFASAKEMVALAERQEKTLGQIAIAYESQILGLSEQDVQEEMKKRFQIMQAAVDQGLQSQNVSMQLLEPTASNVWDAEAKGQVALGGIHTRAAIRALAAMHISNSMGVVCAAPTGGAAGVIPGVLVTLAQEKSLDSLTLADLLFAAGAIGLVVARRATFAAEIAGCQVEIGAAGAMAASAVVEWAGGTAQQAADAAAISFQNTMGSVCDLVQGMCELPCHTRNAVSASSAFVCADLILGGYKNPIPLDETIDAVLSSGKMLPRELRVTALGGLAATPSAKSLPRLRE